VAEKIEAAAFCLTRRRLAKLDWLPIGGPFQLAGQWQGFLGQIALFVVACSLSSSAGSLLAPSRLLAAVQRLKQCSRLSFVDCERPAERPKEQAGTDLGALLGLGRGALECTGLRQALPAGHWADWLLKAKSTDTTQFRLANLWLHCCLCKFTIYTNPPSKQRTLLRFSITICPFVVLSLVFCPTTSAHLAILSNLSLSKGAGEAAKSGAKQCASLFSATNWLLGTHLAVRICRLLLNSFAAGPVRRRANALHCTALVID